jgi:hypothetical protein
MFGVVVLAMAAVSRNTALADATESQPPEPLASAGDAWS